MRKLKRITVRMIPKPGSGTKMDQTVFKAPAGRSYTEETVEMALDRVVDYLDERFPLWEFRMVKVGAGRFNFVYDGERRL
jgi:hypothetical protein